MSREPHDHRPAEEPASIQPSPVRRKLTILLSDDPFADFWEDAIIMEFEDVCELRFIRFDSERRLRTILATECANLVILYIGNIRWEPLPPTPPEESNSGRRSSVYGKWIEILGELSARHSVPVIATQGLDLRADADRAGVTFFQVPCKAGQLITAIYPALGIKPPRDRPESSLL